MTNSHFRADENGVFASGGKHGGKIRVILEVEVVHGESFRGIFTAFLKTKSGHRAVETFKGVSEEESRLAFCFCS